MKFICIFPLLVSVTFGAPQTIASQSSQTVRSGLGLGSITSSARTVDTPHSHHHSHQSSVSNEPLVRIVARPRAVAHHVAAAAGPFTIRAEPQVIQNIQTGPAFLPAGFPAGLPARAALLPAQPTLLPAQPALLPAQPALLPAQPALLPGDFAGEHRLFQTADGQIFAFSDETNQIQPGQIFQTSDGRFFTAAVDEQATIQQGSLFDQESSQGNSDSIITSARDAQKTTEAPKETEEQSNNGEEENGKEAEEALETILKEGDEESEQEAEAQAEVQAEADANSNARKNQQVTTTVIARAPLTPASTGIISGPAVLRPFAAVPRFQPGGVIAAAPVPVRSALVPKGPVAFSLADTVSSGYFTYPNFGIAYEF